MIKKITITIVIITLFNITPVDVSAERLITNPTVFTTNNAPHSAKPVAKKKTTKKAVKSTAKRNLKLGMKGDDVLTLQKLLVKENAGSYAKALAKNGTTRYFGPLTKAALEEFQRAKGLAIDGIAGSKVKAYL